MKKPSLFAPAMPVAVVPEASESESVIATRRPPSREGKRVLSIYLKPEAWKQLRMLAVNLETSTQDLGEEALNLLFEAHRLNRIA
jgi:Antitoxin-like ribbon-helix-helix